MAEYFSFIDRQIVNILKISGLLIPGIEKVVAIYYDYTLDDIYTKSLRRNSSGTQIEDLLIDDFKNSLQKLRTQKESVKWFRKEELPFELKDGNKVEMEIFDEFENVVLMLSFFNENDKKNDLLFFYFNENAGNFEISDSHNALSVKNKRIIEFLLFNNIRAIIETNKNDLQLLKLLIEEKRSNTKSNNLVKENFIILKKKFGQSLGNLCITYVKEFSTQRNKEFKLTEDALIKIANYEGDINNLKPTIERSISCVENTNFDNDKDILEINEWDINFFDYDVKTKPNEKKLEIPNKYTKTILLLDKLENASQEVKSKNYGLTSANVGKAFPTPITAPAISDALKKHRKKILYLLKQHPEKWRIIRNEFRPLLNIIIAKPDLDDLYDSKKGS